MKRQLTTGERYYLFASLLLSEDCTQFNYYYRKLTGRDGKSIWYYIRKHYSKKEMKEYDL